MTARLFPCALFIGTAALLAPVVAWSEDAGPRFVLPPLESFRTIIERPLFAPSRHPSAPGAASGAIAGSQSLRLTGVVSGEDGKKLALVRDGERNIDLRLVVGASLNGWTVNRIDSSGIGLVLGDRQVHVGLGKGLPPTAAR